MNERLTELWTVRFADGKWEVSGVYLDGAKEVGSFAGSDVKVADGALSFVHKFVKKPPRVWLSGATYTAKLDGEKLSYTWSINGSMGTRGMTRAER